MKDFGKNDHGLTKYEGKGMWRVGNRLGKDGNLNRSIELLRVTNLVLVSILSSCLTLIQVFTLKVENSYYENQAWGGGKITLIWETSFVAICMLLVPFMHHLCISRTIIESWNMSHDPPCLLLIFLLSNCFFT